MHVSVSGTVRKETTGKGLQQLRFTGWTGGGQTIRKSTGQVSLGCREKNVAEAGDY